MFGCSRNVNCTGLCPSFVLINIIILYCVYRVDLLSSIRMYTKTDSNTFVRGVSAGKSIRFPLNTFFAGRGSHTVVFFFLL